MVHRTVMKFGLIYPSTADYVNVDLFRESARTADESGFDFFFVWDHYMLPKIERHPEWTNRTLEAFQSLSYAAAVTKKIKLSTVVTPIPFRNVLLLAKETSFLDFLSNERFVLGAGLGWNEEEFRYYSEWKSTAERFRITKEGLTTLIEMWNGSTDEGRLPQIDPRPAKGKSIPIFFGTTGRRMLELCAEIGSGWIPSVITQEQFRETSNKLRSMLKKRNRSLADFTFAADVEDSQLGDRSSRELISRTEEYKSAGASMICETWLCDPRNKEDFIRKIKWYSAEVMKSF
jgi:alkanesulfonate monooxygenase SsuD/methylene tetrahydromethanopterin reductase-like flavin-dependent oxidoreductase (luciferase family)